VALEEGEQRAKDLAVMFIETSAKSSYNVKQVVGTTEVGFCCRSPFTVSVFCHSLYIEKKNGFNLYYGNELLLSAF